MWDWRIPHANARANLGARAREVVYLGWLPAVPLNAAYVARQLANFQNGVPPDDQWNHRGTSLEDRGRPSGEDDGRATNFGADRSRREEEKDLEGGNGERGAEQGGVCAPALEDHVDAQPCTGFGFSELGRRLMGVDQWPP